MTTALFVTTIIVVVVVVVALVRAADDDDVERRKNEPLASFDVLATQLGGTAQQTCLQALVRIRFN
jgi:hypothetical protein